MDHLISPTAPWWVLGEHEGLRVSPGDYVFSLWIWGAALVSSGAFLYFCWVCAQLRVEYPTKGLLYMLERDERASRSFTSFLFSIVWPVAAAAGAIYGVFWLISSLFMWPARWQLARKQDRKRQEREQVRMQKALAKFPRKQLADLDKIRQTLIEDSEDPVALAHLDGAISQLQLLIDEPVQ